MAYIRCNSKYTNNYTRHTYSRNDVMAVTSTGVRALYSPIVPKKKMTAKGKIKATKGPKRIK